MGGEGLTPTVQRSSQRPFPGRPVSVCFLLADRPFPYLLKVSEGVWCWWLRRWWFCSLVLVCSRVQGTRSSRGRGAWREYYLTTRTLALCRVTGDGGPGPGPGAPCSTSSGVLGGRGVKISTRGGRDPELPAVVFLPPEVQGGVARAGACNEFRVNKF